MLARALKRLLLAVLAVVLLLAAVATYSRLTSPSPAQREAMALLEARAVAPGDEGATWLRLALRDDLADAAVAEASRTGVAVPERVGEPPAHGLLPEPCEGPACLAELRASPERQAQAEAWAPAVARLRHGLAFDSVAARPGLHPGVAAGNAPLRALWWGHALAFTRGDAGAVAAACADVDHLRRHASQPANLIERLLYGTLAEQGGGLVAAMLVEAPPAALPPACAALAAEPAPPAGEAFCTALAGEYAFIVLAHDGLQEELAALESAGEGAAAMGARDGGWLLMDDEGMLGMTAQHLAAYCGDGLMAAMRADAAGDIVPPERRPRLVDWVGQPVSVILAEVAKPSYARYVARDLDLLARQRLLAAWLLLHGSDPAVPLAERVAALPAWVHSPTRRIEMGADGASLQVALRGADPGDVARLAMPAPVALDAALASPAATP